MRAVALASYLAWLADRPPPAPRRHRASRQSAQIGLEQHRTTLPQEPALY